MGVYPREEDFLIHRGEYFTAEWYYTHEGRLPGKEFYRELQDPDRRAFFAYVKYLCDSRPGTILPRNMYRIEDASNKIYAFKPRDERFFTFTTVGARVIITNAYHKHSQQMTKLDLEQLRVAIKYRNDYLERIQEGSYYEK
jgi:hypothetical protein